MKIAIAEDYFERYLMAIDEDPIVPVREEDQEDEGIAELTYDGAITPYNVGYFISSLRYVSSDKNIKGVLVTMNSPGGDYEASIRLKSEMESVGKPIYVHTNLMASGGLLASLPADKIFAASDASEIGSIGAVFSYSPTFLQFMKENIKSIYSKHSPRKQEEHRALMEGDESKAMQKIDAAAKWFQNEVQTYRKLKGDISSTLSGAMFTGKSAKRRGLVDQIATYSEAKRQLKKAIS